MKQIVFYEKPGCLGNKRQKSLLEAEGFTLNVKSILDELWEKETLKSFLDKRSVANWFNMTAPDVKNGHIDPLTATEEEALDMMVLDPILIRRPLLEFEGERFCGFDDSVSNTILNHTEQPNDLEKCQSVTINEQCD